MMWLVKAQTFLDVVEVVGDDDGGGGGTGAARNQIEILHDLTDFGHLRGPPIA
jgi:hypothetical protein